LQPGGLRQTTSTRFARAPSWGLTPGTSDVAYPFAAGLLLFWLPAGGQYTSPEYYRERLKDSKDPARLRLGVALMRRTGLAAVQRSGRDAAETGAGKCSALPPHPRTPLTSRPGTNPAPLLLPCAQPSPPVCLGRIAQPTCHRPMLLLPFPDGHAREEELPAPPPHGDSEVPHLFHSLSKVKKNFPLSRDFLSVGGEVRQKVSTHPS